MALRLSRPPRNPLPIARTGDAVTGGSPDLDPRELETWFHDLYRLGNLVGSTTGTPGLIAAGAVGTLAITVTGCLADQAQSVVIGAPSGIDAGLVWCGFISADNTVTVRIYNSTGGGVTPASAEWTARVFR